MTCNSPEHLSIDRRAFLLASGAGFGGLGMPSARGAGPSPAGRKIAKTTVLVWIVGGASHMDMWDMKPKAPRNYRGEFEPIDTSTAGITLCEHLPFLARQTHHLAVVKSLAHPRGGRNNHSSGYYYNLTGHPPDPTFAQQGESRSPRPDDWPFIGSVVTSKVKPHPYLTQPVTLPVKAGLSKTDAWPGQFSARLGLQHEPLYVYANRERPLDFAVPALKLRAGVDIERVRDRRQLLRSLATTERALDTSSATADFSFQQQKAFSLLTSPVTKTAFDINREPEAVREKYGKGINATSLLMARRLVEAGVPFITVFATGRPGPAGAGGWDTHWDNFNVLKKWLLPEFDQPFAAFLDDMSQRGLLDETLVVVSSEMGRKPKIGDPRSGGAKGAGRDHWTYCMSVLMAGAGVRGGQVYGSSDRLAEYPADNPVAPEDIAKTIYYAMGIDNLDALDRDGRPLNLLDRGRPITELF